MKRDTDDIDDIAARIMELLEPFNQAGAPLTPRTDIAADLNIDSADVLDFVMEVEDSFDIDIDINELSDVRTVAQLAELVRRRLRG